MLLMSAYQCLTNSSILPAKNNNNRESVFANDMSANLCFITIFSQIMYRIVASKIVPFLLSFSKLFSNTRFHLNNNNNKKQLLDFPWISFDFFSIHLLLRKFEWWNKFWIGEKSDTIMQIEYNKTRVSFGKHFHIDFESILLWFNLLKTYQFFFCSTSFFIKFCTFFVKL